MISCRDTFRASPRCYATLRVPGLDTLLHPLLYSFVAAFLLLTALTNDASSSPYEARCHFVQQCAASEPLRLKHIVYQCNHLLSADVIAG